MTMQAHILRAAAVANTKSQGRSIVVQFGPGTAQIVFPASGVTGQLNWGDGSPLVVNPTGVQTRSIESSVSAEFEGNIAGGTLTVAGTAQKVLDWIEGPVRYVVGGASQITEVPPWLPRTVTQLSSMFSGAMIFNQFLPWDTSNVTLMNSCFTSASGYNQPLPWNTSKVNNANNMFNGALSFDQDLSHWCVTLIPEKPSNFDTNTPAWDKAGRQPIWGTCP